MNYSHVGELLRDRLSLLLGIPRSEIRDDSRFDDLGADSLMLLELVAVVEQAIGRQLVEEDIGRLGSIDDVQQYVAALEAA